MTVTAFRRYQLTNIPEALRMLAQQIESGDEPTERCIVIIERPESYQDPIDYKAFGAEPFSRAHAIGLCFAAAHAIL